MEMLYSIAELVKARALDKYSPYLIKAALKQTGKKEFSLKDAISIVETYANKTKGAR